MRQVLTNIMLIAVTVALLVHFILIAIYGGVTIQEPNVYILTAEMVGLLSIVGFAIFNLARLE